MRGGFRVALSAGASGRFPHTDAAAAAIAVPSASSDPVIVDAAPLERAVASFAAVSATASVGASVGVSDAATAALVSLGGESTGGGSGGSGGGGISFSPAEAGRRVGDEGGEGGSEGGGSTWRISSVVTGIGWWCGVTEFGVPGCVNGVDVCVGASGGATALLAPAAAVSAAASLPAAAAAVLSECISSVPESDSSALDPSSG